MTHFYLKPSKGSYVDADYTYYGSMNDYELFEGDEETFDEQESIAFVWENRQKREEMVGWLNGACNNL